MEYVRLMSAFPPRTTGVVVTKCEILAENSALHEPKMLLTIRQDSSERIFTVGCNVTPVWFQKPPEYDVMLLVLKHTAGTGSDADGNVATRLLALGRLFIARAAKPEGWVAYS